MHAVPGGQNGDWHSDNPTNHAAFWDHKDHQDRTIWLWSEIATRYRHNPWVAGYNPINEPCDPQHARLPAFYKRFESAIRKIDQEHILWLDGNTFAMEWKDFSPLVSGASRLPNCVLALHDYSAMGFPSGETYVGSDEQKAKLERQFVRKADFMLGHKVPAWNGEFGPVYEDRMETESEAANRARCELLGEQLKIYDKYAISWSIWLYKDIGLQGMVYTDPASKWNGTIKGFLEKKRNCKLDAWGTQPSEEVEALMKPLVAWVEKISPTAKDMCKY